MTNCEYYHSIVQRYRKGLTEINGKYDGQIRAKESYRGSAGYQAEIEEIEQKREAEIAALRANCRESFDICIKSMELHAKECPMTPPTPETLAILQALQMREHLTRDDLEHAANTMQDCPVALGVLDELGRKHEIMGFHAGGSNVSDQFVRDAIRSFATSAREILSLDRCGIRGQQLDFSGGPYGTSPTFASIGKFRVDVEPQGPMDCAERFGGVSDEAYKAFVEVVQ